MQSFNRDDLLKRKAELETALQQAADEFQRITGAIQFLDALVLELGAQPEENIK